MWDFFNIGNISSVYINQRIPLYLSDYNDRYCQLLKTKFAAAPDIKNIFRIDLADKNFELLTILIYLIINIQPS
jgi:hypothetical protein